MYVLSPYVLTSLHVQESLKEIKNTDEIYVLYYV
jgi:hypothetical protein